MPDCDHCGAWNADWFARCHACGKPLQPRGAPPPEAAGTCPFCYWRLPAHSPGCPHHGEAPGSQATGNPSGGAIAALICGVAGLSLCCWPLGVAGLILGLAEQRAITAGRAPESGRAMAILGWVLGIIATLLGLLWFAWFVLMGVLGAIDGV